MSASLESQSARSSASPESSVEPAVSDTAGGKWENSTDRSQSPDREREMSGHDTTAAASGAELTGTNASPAVTPGLSSASATAVNGDWQAVWSPAHNAYYFYNTKTQETTWTNPLQPTASSAGASPDADPPAAAGSSSLSPTPGPSSSMYDLQAAAVAQGIDPALAYLDPSLAAGPSNPAFTYSAKFNARSGTFAKQDARDPTHLSEYERAKRMSEFYFDVNAWEQEVEARKLEEAHEEETKKRKRPTKKDLERFREQKRLKKIAKTAWLRT